MVLSGTAGDKAAETCGCTGRYGSTKKYRKIFSGIESKSYLCRPISCFMRRKSEFLIEFEGLKYGAHLYEWEIGTEFFEQYGEVDAQQPSFRVHMELFKDTVMMVLKLRIEGTGQYDCDLCLNPLLRRFSLEHSLVVKPGGDEEDADDDILVLPKNAYELDMSDVIYQLIKVAEPVKRSCDTAEPLAECEKEFMQQYLATEVEEQPAAEEEAEDEPEADPRWEALRKFKENPDK